MKVIGTNYYPTPEEAQTIVDFLGAILLVMEECGRPFLDKNNLKNVQLYNMIAAEGPGK
jgi:hypothetical protein